MPMPVEKHSMKITPQAKRSLGQNFLRDANIARKIVQSLAVSTDDQVLEIGPGPGALSGILRASAPQRLVLLENDAYWAADRAGEDTGALFYSMQTYLEQGGRPFAVIAGDALTAPWEILPGIWKCIGNLPYNIASPLLWEICCRFAGLRRAVFMVQKEVGQRIVAEPGSSAYGALSVWVQTFMRPKMEFIVPPHVFHPRPKVDSAVLSFIPLSERPSDELATSLKITLRACFQRRRKQLGTIARAHGARAENFECMGIDPMLRPEALPVSAFHLLASSRIFAGKD
jgi:16S rRNA (adenine1518-N6/adenine1519-N6)-dimethyltransferase